MKKIPRMIAEALLIALLLSLAGCGSADGKTHLTFQIWDTNQRAGMDAMGKAYTAQHPDVVIDVQVVSWNEYWTKLETAAESNTMPDIFWMHTNQLLYYADFGVLADLTDADQKIYDTTGKYGYLAYLDDQLGYWSYVYQNGGYILTADRTACGFNQPGGKEAMKFYIGLQKENWCPDQNYFTQNGAGATFWAQRAAMFMEGSWSLLGALRDHPEMTGKWDIAKLPKAPNPVSTSESLDQDGRACMSNGLCYSTAARGRNLEIVKDVLKYFGTEEAQLIQGESGAAIPAYLDTEESWRAAFAQYGSPIDVDCIFGQFDYAIQVPYNSASPRWKSQVLDVLTQVYAGNEDVDAGLEKIENIVNTKTAKKLADH